MENITMIPMTDVNVWQLSLSALGCATSALASLEVQGTVLRPATANAAAQASAFAPFAAGDAAQAIDGPSVKRERATTGMGRHGLPAYVPGPPAWSHPN